MADDELKAPEKPGPGLPEKKNLMIAGIVVAVLIIAVIAVVVSIQLPAGKGTAQPAVIKNFTQPEKGVYSAQTQNVQKTIRQTSTRTIRQTPTLQKTPSLPVDFVLQPGDPVSAD